LAAATVLLVATAATIMLHVGSVTSAAVATAAAAGLGMESQ